jgi:hypothetical protein
VGTMVSGATVMQEPRLRPASRSSIRIFFITGILLGKSEDVPHPLLKARFEFQPCETSSKRTVPAQSQEAPGR